MRIPLYFGEVLVRLDWLPRPPKNWRCLRCGRTQRISDTDRSGRCRCGGSVRRMPT